MKKLVTFLLLGVVCSATFVHADYTYNYRQLVSKTLVDEDDHWTGIECTYEYEYYYPVEEYTLIEQRTNKRWWRHSCPE